MSGFTSLWPWGGQKHLSDAARAYVDGTPRKISGKTPLENLSFLVLDAETTGFDLIRDRLLSLAIVPVAQGKLRVAGLCNWTIFQPGARLNAAVKVHGILPAETAQGEPEATVMTEALPLLTGRIIVGHHVGFDAALLGAALKRHHGVALRNPLIDTAELAMRALEAFGATAYPGQRPPTLDEVCANAGLRPMERHTAEGDAFTTAELFLLLCSRLQRRRARALTAADLPITAA